MGRDVLLQHLPEQAVLEALASLAPMPLTRRQIALLVRHASYHEVSTVLHALVLVGAIARPFQGYYYYCSG